MSAAQNSSAAASGLSVTRRIAGRRLPTPNSHSLAAKRTAGFHQSGHLTGLLVQLPDVSRSNEVSDDEARAT